jgi:hypothetical protein
MAWTCPCGTSIPYKDYELVRRPDVPYHCRNCGLALVRDKRTDELIAALPTTAPNKPPAERS